MQAYEGSDLSWIEVGISKGTLTRGWAVGERKRKETNMQLFEDVTGSEKRVHAGDWSPASAAE